MIKKATSLEGVYLIEAEKIRDERGFFSRTYCSLEFEEMGLSKDRVQSNLSFNAKAGTLRGFHYQTAPGEEVKIIRCISGSIYDVVIDLRSESRTYLKWMGIELKAADYQALYIPAGFAHAYLAIQDETTVLYDVSSPYQSSLERGIRFNDPLFNIAWPYEVMIISKKDSAWPDFKPINQEGTP